MPPTPASVPRRRWRIAFLLAFGVIVNFWDRVNLSVSQDALHAAFGLSLIAFGYLSSAFSWTYALMQVPAGLLLDRFGVKRVGRVSTFLWSLAGFGAALSPDLAGFFAARFLLGIAESPTFPGNAKALGHWFTRRERSLATAITDAAAKFSTAVGVPFLGVLLLGFGWRWSFAATGFVSLFYFALFYVVYRNPSQDPALSAAEHGYLLAGGAQLEDVDGKVVPGEDRLKEAALSASLPAVDPPGEAWASAIRSPHRASLAYLLRQPKIYGLAMGWGAYNYSFFLFLTWLPSYLSLTVHIDLLHSAFYTAVPWLFATITDLVVGGWLVDALIQRGWNADRVRRAVLISGTACGLGILGAAGAHTPRAALLWISLALGGLAAAAPVAWTVPSLIAPRETVGAVGGLVNFSGQIMAICAPIITGYIAQGTHSFAAAFATATVILLVGICGYAFLLGRIEPIPEPEQVPSASTSS